MTIKELETQFQQLSANLAEQSTIMKQVVENQQRSTKRMEDLESKFTLLMDQISQNRDSPAAVTVNTIASGSEIQSNTGKGILPTPKTTDKGGYSPTSTKGSYSSKGAKMPKVEISDFNGENPRNFIRKCEKYFRFYSIAEEEQIEIATMRFGDIADNWLQGWVSDQTNSSWSQFSKDLCERFGEKSSMEIVAEFNKLQQGAESVVCYQERFEQLKAIMQKFNPGLSESYFISSFISGLSEELRAMLMVHRPITLNQAFTQAKYQEQSFEAVLRRHKLIPGKITTGKSSYPISFPSPKPTILQPKEETNKDSGGKTNTWEQRKAAGLCFKCGDRFSPGHQCKNKTLLAMEANIDDIVQEELTCEETEGENLKGELSLAAVTGQKSPNTLRIKGNIHGVPVVILLDTGSTHSFMNAGIAARVQAAIVTTATLSVTVANGEQILSQTVCQGMKWNMQGQEYAFDLRVLTVVGYDIVLGVDWMIMYNPLLFDFVGMTLTFNRDGNEVKLQGIQDQGELHCVSGKKMTRLIKEGGALLPAQLFSIKITEPTVENQLNTGIAEPVQALLQQYETIFATPTALPPERSHDHAINLLPNTKPVNIRPYHHNYFQKTEIEKQVKEMLNTGVIQCSHSPFASPVLLVKKKDGTWRFCVDYRQLNEMTVKDKFPIPVIDDLLDELNGARFFSKIDLRAGYHQIRVRVEDVYKTAFRTHHGHYEFKVMPFGLTNAPATFQSLMNQIFEPYLRQFILVFFDDILIYSRTLEEHLNHLKKVFDILSEHKLFAKQSKCSFAQTRVEYLGHVIDENGVHTDPSKIEVMQNWPVPTNLKSLRGFLGLTGYYRKFIYQYGAIARPLTNLLKKDAFEWSNEAQQAFVELKKAMGSAPVLALPDFAKTFVLETDASSTGIGAVLMQDGRPIAFMSKPLSQRNQGLSIYEKELLAIIQAVQKWRHYLDCGEFIIKTDQEAIKHLLSQRLHTYIQQKGITKLLGLNYKICYKKGKENKAADALSRRDWTEMGEMNLLISTVVPTWVQEVLTSYEHDEAVKEMIRILLIDAVAKPHYSLQEGLLYYKGRLYIGQDSKLKDQLLNNAHNSALGGHAGVGGTHKRLSTLFYWPNMIQSVKDWVGNCDVCQRCKSEHVAYPGLLQPLPVPQSAWQHISMDFIEQLPRSNGKDTILVVVDRFTKYAHFVPLRHPFTAQSVAQQFFDTIFKLHGLPSTIVSDRDKIFTSLFWQELFKLLQTKLQLSTSYHPQTDGQTERVNQCLENYLRCMCFHKPTAWSNWLSLAEWWYNTNYHSSLKMTPFEALYGIKPPVFHFISDFHTPSAAAEEFVQQRQHMTSLIRDQLLLAQSRMKQQADKGRSERTFEVGDFVYLKLQPYRQSSVSVRRNLKLSAKYYGPYQILAKIGEVAYQLKLPEEAKIHDVFHVSLLKKAVGNPLVTTPLPLCSTDGTTKVEPAGILQVREVIRNGQLVKQALVQWVNLHPDESTWEDLTFLYSQFPELHLADKVSLKRGSNVIESGQGLDGIVKHGYGLRKRGVIGPKNKA